MERESNVIIERDEEGWCVARVPEIRGCHTQAESPDKLKSRIREAIEACLESGGGPKATNQFVGLQRLRFA